MTSGAGRAAVGWPGRAFSDLTRIATEIFGAGMVSDEPAAAGAGRQDGSMRRAHTARATSWGRPDSSTTGLPCASAA